jgi:hypothetical protein
MADWQERETRSMRCPKCTAVFGIEGSMPLPDRLRLPLHEPNESDPNKVSLKQVCPGSHLVAEVILPDGAHEARDDSGESGPR